MRPAEGRPSLRPAGPGDSDLLLAWAKDPVTRASSFHPGPIDPVTHARWFAERLVSSDGRIWIGEMDGRPMGQVRAERVGVGRAEVGISVAPEARGRGLARGLLTAGMDAARRELDVTSFIAAVRPENAVSLALFRGAGFVDDADGERNGIACSILIHDDGPGGR